MASTPLQVGLDTPLNVLRMDVVALDDGVLLRRGSSELMVAGSQARQICETLFSEPVDRPSSIRELLGKLSASQLDQAAALLRHLLEADYISPLDGASVETESEFDVFYWDFGTSRAKAQAAKAKARIAILGSVDLALAIAGSLRRNDGWQHVDMVLPETAAGLEAELAGRVAQPKPASTFAFADYDLVIGGELRGGRDQLRAWNGLAVSAQVPFLPVLFDNMVCRIGPLVRSAQHSPCLECLFSREGANDTASSAGYLAAARRSSRTTASLHPAVTALVGELVALEAEKLVSALPATTAGALIELRPLLPSVTQRKVLRNPRCPVCSRANQHPEWGLVQNLE